MIDEDSLFHQLIEIAMDLKTGANTLSATKAKLAKITNPHTDLKIAALDAHIDAFVVALEDIIKADTPNNDGAQKNIAELALIYYEEN